VVIDGSKPDTVRRKSTGPATVCVPRATRACGALLRIKAGGIVRVLLAGAGGAVGQQMIPLLIREGHTVGALTDREQTRSSSCRWVVDTFIADALDPSAVQTVVETFWAGRDHQPAYSHSTISESGSLRPENLR